MRLIYLTDVEKFADAGLPWQSVHAARWDFRHRYERGIADAFVRIGRRVAVDPDAYHRLVRRKVA